MRMKFMLTVLWLFALILGGSFALSTYAWVVQQALAQHHVSSGMETLFGAASVALVLAIGGAMNMVMRLSLMVNILIAQFTILSN